MSDGTKNLVDVILTMTAMIGAVVAFLHTLREWQSSQRWRRSEYLDKFVEIFERDELVRLARTVVDWTSRSTKYREGELAITNNDVLLALRPHEEMGGERYSGNQAIIREAYDALLGFFCRLEIAIQSQLIDVGPTRSYFEYWLRRLVLLDRHDDRDHVLGGRSPEEMVAKYVHAYSDVRAICHLCDLFEVSIPAPLKRAREGLHREQEIASMIRSGRSGVLENG